MQTQNSSGNEQIKISDGFSLFSRKWLPPNQSERVVIFFHGIEVHSGAFEFFGSELASEGSVVYGFDRRGMGNSKEPNLQRGDTQDFDRHLADLDEVVEYVRKNNP